MSEGATPPGWYLDPADPATARWWDGRGWTDYRMPASAPAAPAAPAAPTAAGREGSARPATGTGVAARSVLVGAAGSLLLVITAVSAGIGGVLMVAGLMALVVGGYTLLRGRSRTFRVRSRGVAALVLVGGLVVTSAGTAAFGATHPAPPTRPAAVRSEASSTAADSAAVPVAVRRAPARSAAPGPSPSASSSGTPAAGSALALLARLPVKGRAPMTGYARTADFGTAWLDVDRNGCDTRNDILRRDLTATTGSGCRVLSGTLADPYTGKSIHFVRGQVTSLAVQIDHVVALGDAWQTGAQRLSESKRIDLANDPINLFAVDGPTNEQKGDGDAATWLPPVKAFRCTYIAHQVSVKAAYHLWVTRAEHDAMARVLERCPDARALKSTVVSVVNAVSAPRSSGSSSSGARSGSVASSHPSLYYTNCTAVRAAGKAPLHRGQAGYRAALDRDGDGVACESTAGRSRSSGSSTSGSVSSGAGAPAGATAKCRDGSYSSSQHHSGTCSHHGGVAAWL